MTETNHRKEQTFFHLDLELGEFTGLVVEKAELLYRSGGVDPEAYGTDGRMLAKVLAIATYKEAQTAFHEATAKTQASLEACGWKWVKKDISGYSESGDYQYWLVTPQMFEALKLAKDIENDTPEIVEEPNYIHWHEFVDYILF
jgi:hypothetical protein